MLKTVFNASIVITITVPLMACQAHSKGRPAVEPTSTYHDPDFQSDIDWESYQGPALDSDGKEFWDGTNYNFDREWGIEHNYQMPLDFKAPRIL